MEKRYFVYEISYTLEDGFTSQWVEEFMRKKEAKQYIKNEISFNQFKRFTISKVYV
jgi:hypothetical protein